jgi:hypothetical protein
VCTAESVPCSIDDVKVRRGSTLHASEKWPFIFSVSLRLSRACLDQRSFFMRIRTEKEMTLGTFSNHSIGFTGSIRGGEEAETGGGCSRCRAPSVGQGVARSGSITARLAAANSFDSSSAVGVSSEVCTTAARSERHAWLCQLSVYLSRACLGKLNDRISCGNDLQAERRPSVFRT